MAGDLSECATLARCFEANAFKVKSTFEDILQKYDREFPGDAIVDLRHHRIIRNKDIVTFMSPRRIGSTAFETQDHLLTESPKRNLLDNIPYSNYSPESEKSFISANCSKWVTDIDEENEPSDAETLTSNDNSDSELGDSDSWEEEIQAEEAVEQSESEDADIGADWYLAERPGEDISGEEGRWLSLSRKEYLTRKQAAGTYSEQKPQRRRLHTSHYRPLHRSAEKASLTSKRSSLPSHTSTSVTGEWQRNGWSHSDRTGPCSSSAHLLSLKERAGPPQRVRPVRLFKQQEKGNSNWGGMATAAQGHFPQRRMLLRDLLELPGSAAQSDAPNPRRVRQREHSSELSASPCGQMIISSDEEASEDETPQEAWKERDIYEEGASLEMSSPLDVDELDSYSPAGHYGACDNTGTLPPLERVLVVPGESRFLAGLRESTAERGMPGESRSLAGLRESTAERGMPGESRSLAGLRESTAERGMPGESRSLAGLRESTAERGMPGESRSLAGLRESTAERGMPGESRSLAGLRESTAERGMPGESRSLAGLGESTTERVTETGFQKQTQENHATIKDKRNTGYGSQLMHEIHSQAVLHSYSSCISRLDTTFVVAQGSPPKNNVRSWSSDEPTLQDFSASKGTHHLTASKNRRLTASSPNKDVLPDIRALLASKQTEEMVSTQNIQGDEHQATDEERKIECVQLLKRSSLIVGSKNTPRVTMTAEPSLPKATHHVGNSVSRETTKTFGKPASCNDLHEGSSAVTCSPCVALTRLPTMLRGSHSTGPAPQLKACVPDIRSTSEALHETAEVSPLVELRRTLDRLSRNMTPKKKASAYSAPDRSNDLTGTRERELPLPPNLNSSSKTDPKCSADRMVAPEDLIRAKYSSPLKSATAINVSFSLYSPLPLVKIESPEQWSEIRKKFRPALESVTTKEIKRELEMQYSESLGMVTLLKQKQIKTEPAFDKSQFAADRKHAGPVSPWKPLKYSNKNTPEVGCGSMPKEVDISASNPKCFDSPTVNNSTGGNRVPNAFQERGDNAFDETESSTLQQLSKQSAMSNGVGIFRASPGEIFRQTITAPRQISNKQSREPVEADSVVAFSVPSPPRSYVDLTAGKSSQETFCVSGPSQDFPSSVSPDQSPPGSFVDSTSGKSQQNRCNRETFCVSGPSQVFSSSVSPDQSPQDLTAGKSRQNRCNQETFCVSGSSQEFPFSVSPDPGILKSSLFSQGSKPFPAARVTSDCQPPKHESFSQASEQNRGQRRVSGHSIQQIFMQLKQASAQKSACRSAENKHVKQQEQGKNGSRQADGAKHDGRSSKRGHLGQEAEAMSVLVHGKETQDLDKQVVDKPLSVHRRQQSLCGHGHGQTSDPLSFLSKLDSVNNSTPNKDNQGRAEQSAIRACSMNTFDFWGLKNPPVESRTGSARVRAQEVQRMQGQFLFEKETSSTPDRLQGSRGLKKSNATATDSAHRQAGNRSSPASTKGPRSSSPVDLSYRQRAGINESVCAERSLEESSPGPKSLSARMDASQNVTPCKQCRHKITPSNLKCQHNVTPSKLISGLTLGEKGSPLNITQNCDTFSRLLLTSPLDRPSQARKQGERIGGGVTASSVVCDSGDAGRRSRSRIRRKLLPHETDTQSSTFRAEAECGDYFSSADSSWLRPEGRVGASQPANGTNPTGGAVALSSGLPVAPWERRRTDLQPLRKLKGKDRLEASDSLAGKLSRERDSSHPTSETEVGGLQFFRLRNSGTTERLSCGSSGLTPSLRSASPSERVVSESLDSKGSKMIRISSPNARLKNTLEQRSSFDYSPSLSSMARSKRGLHSHFDDLEKKSLGSPLKRRRINTIQATSTPSKSSEPSPVKFDMDESMSTIAGEISGLNSTVQSTDGDTEYDPNTCSDEEDDITLVPE